MNTDGLEGIAESTRDGLEAKHRAREMALPLTRDVVRLSANAIRATHRGEFDAADALLVQAREKLDKIEDGLRDQRDIYHTGFVNDAQKEFAEANTTLALIAGRPLPTPQDLGVMGPAYLNGIGETIGELRRHLLDRLRAGDIEHCEETLSAMSDIYDMLMTMDYPEAVTSGLRRTSDAMRAILERTRGDFTMAYVQRRLEGRLGEFRGKE